MAQAKGSAGQFLAGVNEATYNVNPVTTGSTSLPFITCGIKATQSMITSKMITLSRNPPQPTTGNIAIAGPVVVPVDRSGIGFWLRMLMNVPVTTGAGDPYTHVFKVPSSLNSHVMEQGYTDIAQFQRLNGCKVGSMTGSFDISSAAEPVLTFGVTAATSTWGGASMDATPSTFAYVPFSLSSVAIEEGGGVVTNVQSVTFDYNNVLDDKGYCFGNSGAIAQLPEGMVMVKGTIKAMFENLTLLNKTINGTESSIKMTFTETTHSLALKFNEIQYTMTSPAITGPTGVWLEADWTAFYSNHADASALTATLISPFPAYA